MKRFLLFLLIITILLGCSKKELEPWEKVLTKQEIKDIIDKVKGLKSVPVEKDEIAVIETTLGTIKFKFFPDAAPVHCEKFKMLANNEFYDGIKFHRVMPGFMIQAGDIFSRDDDPGNDGGGSPGYNLKAEFNNISHKRGIVSMARRGYHYDTAGSQFFIVHADYPSLDRQYTVFGEVIEGMDVVDKIAAAETDGERPVVDIIMKKVRVVKNQ